MINEYPLNKDEYASYVKKLNKTQLIEEIDKLVDALDKKHQALTIGHAKIRFLENRIAHKYSYFLEWEQAIVDKSLYSSITNTLVVPNCFVEKRCIELFYKDSNKEKVLKHLIYELNKNKLFRFRTKVLNTNIPFFHLLKLKTMFLLRFKI